MIYTYQKHIIAKKNYDITKNKFFIAKKRHFLTFFAIYSKRDFGLGWVHSNVFSRVIVEAFFGNLFASWKPIKKLRTNEAGIFIFNLIFWGVGFPQNARHFGKTHPRENLGEKNQNSGFIRFSFLYLVLKIATFAWAGIGKTV